MNRHRQLFCLAWALAQLPLFNLSASAATLIWTNLAGGSWNVTSNWDPHLVPGVADTALITNNGTYTVTLSFNTAVSNVVVGGVSGTQTLTISSGGLTVTNATVANSGLCNVNSSSVAGYFTVDGTLNFNAATIAVGGFVTVASSGVLNIGGNSTTYLQGNLTNAGTVNWTGTANLQLYHYTSNNGLFVNQPGALFNIQNDQTIGSGSGSPFLVNAGTVLKSAGTNTLFNVPLTNSGTLNIAAGTISVAFGGTSSGVINGAGSVTVTGGTLTSVGTVPNLVVAGGTFNGINATITNLTVSSGGALQGTNTLVALADWTSGAINPSSSLTIASTAVLNISGTSTHYLYGALTNAGTVNWGGTGNLQLYYYSANNGEIINQPGALFNIQNDQSVGVGSGNPFFINAGTVQKSSGTNTTFNVPFTNTATLTISSGTVTIAASGNNTGIINGPGTVAVPSGTLTSGGAILNLLVNGGTFNGNNAIITNLTLNFGGALQGNSTVAAQASWTSGAINPGSSLTIASAAVLNISGTSTLYLYGALTNAGTVNWGGTGNLQLYYYSSNIGQIINQPGALFNIQNDQSIGVGSGNPFFFNRGLVQKSAGTNTTFNVTFTNAATLNIGSGTITIGGTANNTAVITGPGIVAVPGTLTSAGAIQNLLVDGGTFIGINATITNLTLNFGGSLQGNNTVVGLASWTSGSVGAGSSLTIASTGVLNLNGSSTLYLYGALTNAGTVNWSGTGNLQLYYYSANIGQIINQPGALFNIQNDQSIGLGAGAPFFYNAGTLQKSGGTNTSINVAFTNVGILSLTIYSQSSFSKLSLGTAALGGSLTVGYANTYSPAIGDAFGLLNYSSETGVFAAVNLPANGPAWQTNFINYGATAFTLTFGSIYKLAFTSGPYGTNTAGATFATVSVQTETLDGAPLATNGVPITLAMTSGSGTLSGTLTQPTDSTGKASFNNLSIDLVGLKILTASSPPWLTPASSPVVITAAPPARLRLVSSPVSPQRQGYAFTPAPRVQVLDLFGNIVSNSAALITASAVGSGGGTLGGTLTTNANGTNGAAILGNLHYTLGNPNTAESVVLYFNSPGLLAVTNAPITVDYVSGFINLTNRNSFVQIDPNSQNGVFSWTVDGVEQLYQHWYWLRLTNTGPQLSLDQFGAPLGTLQTATNAIISYLPPGLSVTLSFALQGGLEGSHVSSLVETLVIQNTNGVPTTLHLYDYADFDLGGTNEGDTVSFPTNNIAVQQGKGMTATQVVQGTIPNYWEGSWYSFAYDTINSTTPAVLPDAIIPNQAGDQTFAFQWDVTLGAGQTLMLNVTNSIQIPVSSSFLSIGRTGANAVLSWPTNGSGNLTLQFNRILNAAGTWTNVATVPTIVGTNYQVTLPVAGAAQFFRLH